MAGAGRTHIGMRPLARSNPNPATNPPITVPPARVSAWLADMDDWDADDSDVFMATLARPTAGERM